MRRPHVRHPNRFELALVLLILVTGCGSPSTPTPPDPYPTGPHAVCPPPVSTTSPNGQPLPVAYGTPTAEGGAPPVTLACTPASGTLFPVGTTSVTCTATDARQRADSCTFAVTVTAPPMIRLTRFVAFGDSITFGENGISSQPFGFGPLFQVASPYPSSLYRLLAGRYTSQNLVVANAGSPAEFASDARGRFSQVIGSGSYDAVLLMEGTNDVSYGVAGSAINALRAMVQDAKSRGVAPYLATIPPMDGLMCCPRRGSAAPLVPGFNDGVREIAASEGIPLVDVYAALNTAPTMYLSQDGLHPNEAGYDKIAETFFTVLRSTLEASSSPTAFWRLRPVP